MAGLEVAWALAIVLAFLGVIRIAAHYAGFDAGAQRGRSLRVVETCALGAKRNVMLVEAAGERLLIGSSESGITLLRVMPAAPAAPTSGEAPGPLATSGGNADPVCGASAARSTGPGADAPAIATLDTAPDSARSHWRHKLVRLGGRLPTIALFASVAALGLGLGLGLAGEAHAAAEVSADALRLSLEGADGAKGLSSSIELLLLMTLITVAPSLLLMGTCFTRIVIVLAFVRQALGVQHLPPNQVLVGLALFLTLFVMAPLGEAIKTDAYEPYTAGEIEAAEAIERGLVPIRRYLMSYARESDLALFQDLANANNSAAGGAAATPPAEPELKVLMPAFLLSELRTAFEIGFTVFLPFLVIDLVIASMLISMGMIVLPPIVVSLPFKLMLFVLVDGWNLVLGALVNGLR